MTFKRKSVVCFTVFFFLILIGSVFTSSGVLSSEERNQGQVVNAFPGHDSGMRLENYVPQFNVYNVVDKMTLTPIFTPDNALGVYAYWLSRANTSINVETQYISKFDDSSSWDNDPSPIVRGLVAAHNRGVDVRVIVNEDLDTDDVTSYFESVGIKIRWMGANNSYPQRLTFTHNKFISIDGKITILSSANFGPNAFYNNREAGMVIRHQGLTSYYDSVFELDWKMSAPDEPGEPGALNSIAVEKEKVANRDLEKTSVELSYSTSFVPENFTGTYNATAFISPDTVDKVVFDYLRAAKKSIYVTMYTISRPDFVNELISLKQANPSLDIRVLISHRRVGYTENLDTVAAAKKLVGALIPVRNTTSDFRFTHAKYWIIDGKYTFVYTGNWSNRSAPPAESSYSSSEANRDMGIAVVGEDIANYYTTVFESDWKVGTPWEMPIAISMSLQDGDIVMGATKVSINANQIENVEYKIDDSAWVSASSTGSGTYEFSWDTLKYDNGIHVIYVRGTYNGQIFENEAKVTVVNTGDDWRLLVTEVLYDAEGTDSGKEYFEISNTFPFDVFVDGWSAGDSKLTKFPSDYVFKAKTSVIFCQDTSLFQQTYGVTGDFEADFGLTNTGDYVQLVDNRGNVIDAVAWGSAVAPDGSTTFTGEAKDGKSLSRDPLWIDTDNADNDFKVTSPNPKQPITYVPPIGEASSSTEEIGLPFSIIPLISSMILLPVIIKKNRRKE